MTVDKSTKSRYNRGNDDFGREGNAILLLLEHFGIQLLFTVGVIVLTGLTVSGVKRFFLKCCGRGAHSLEIITGIVGTPIHELSHAFFCIVFGHKITGIRLWSPNASDGNLGYVTHTYRKKNPWHQLGNFFIGVAPILGGGAVLYLLLLLLLPDAAGEILPDPAVASPVGVEMLPSVLLAQVKAVFSALLNPTLFLYWHWYLYLFLAVLIVLHMEISVSDLRSGLWGFLFLAVFLFLLDGVMMLWNPEGLVFVTALSVRIGALLLSFYCLALLLSVLLTAISLVAAIARRKE